jgi:cysteine synthase B
MAVQVLNTADQELVKKIESIEAYVGNTPLYQVKNVFNKPGVDIFAKLEWQQIGHSVKARPAFNIIKQAVKAGLLNREIHLLDASSGNTGVAYGAIGYALGIPVTLCLPENASTPKKDALKQSGVNIIYTSRFEGTDGAQQKAKELAENFPHRYFYADQYSNPNNWKAHYYGTAEEIWEQTEGKITHLVTGLGTTGSFTGTARRLKELNPNIEVVSLQPDTAMHGLEGWKHLETAIVPKFYDPFLADRNLLVSTEEAYKLIKLVNEKEGLLLSPSSAANLAGAIKVAKELQGGTIVTVFPDHGSNYPEVLKQLL